MGEKETLNPAIIAKVGNGAGTVVVSGRPGWIYVRLHGDDNQLTEAKLGIPLDTGSLNDAWVRVKKASPRKASYYAVEEFITSSTGDPAPPMSAHPLDPDAGPHTGKLTEDDVVFDDATGHDHQGAGNKGKKVDYADLANKEHAPSHAGGADPLDVKDLPDSEGRLLTGPQKTDLTDGGFTVLHQHAGGGGAADSLQIILTNRTGGERTAGDVVVTDADNDESFVGTPVAGYQGKVLVVAATVADLTGGPCWERGGPFYAKVIGTVSRNDGLRTSATIYRAEAAPSITGGGVFAVALAPNISGEGTVKAVFLDAIGGGGGGVGTIEIQEDDVKKADASIVNFEGGGGKVTDEGGGKVTVDITPGAGGGAWTLIEDIELAAPAASIDFQNIPGTYKHLVIFFSARSDRNVDIDVMGIRFNNDAGGNYDWARHRGGTLHQNDTGFSDNEIETPLVTAVTSPANAFGSGTLHIYDYTDTAKRKGVKVMNGMLRGAATIYTVDGWGEWQTANAAITRVTLFLTTGDNFIAGSRATLYGIS